MSDKELAEETIRLLSEHVAAGKPVIITSSVPCRIGAVVPMMLQKDDTNPSNSVKLQQVRIVRLSSPEEFRATMPRIPGVPFFVDPDAYCYEVESD